MRKIGNGEGREDKGWGEVLLHKLCLLPRKLLKKNSIMYATSSGERKEMGDFYEVSRNCHELLRVRTQMQIIAIDNSDVNPPDE